MANRTVLQVDQAEPEDQIVSRDQQKRRYDANLGSNELLFAALYIKYQTKYTHSLLTLSRLIRETLFERKNLIDILTLKPERLLAVQDEPIQRALF